MIFLAAWWRITEDLHPKPVKAHSVFEADPARLSGLSPMKRLSCDFTIPSTDFISRLFATDNRRKLGERGQRGAEPNASRRFSEYPVEVRTESCVVRALPSR